MKTLAGGVGDEPKAWPTRAVRNTLANAVLSCCLYLSMVRSTNIGLFYPPDEFQLGLINYTPQTIMNFVLLFGMIGLAVLKNDYGFLKVTFRDPLITLLFVGMAIATVCSVEAAQSLKFVLAVIAISFPCILYTRDHGADSVLLAMARFGLVMAIVNLAYVVALPQYGIMVARHAGEWRGMFEHKNGSGPFFAISFWVMAYQLRHHGLLRNLTFLLGMAAAFIFVVYSRSTTGYVVFAFLGASCFGMFFIFRLGSARDRIAAALLAIGIMLTLYLVAGSAAADLFFSTTGKDSTLTGRTGIWRVILALVAQRPLTGYGPGMSERPDFMVQIQGDVGWEAKGTHNSYLDMLIGFGYPETILIIFTMLRLWLSAFRICIVQKSVLRRYVMASSLVLTVLLVSMANAGALVSRYAFWLFAVGGLAIIFYEPRRGALHESRTA